MSEKIKIYAFYLDESTEEDAYGFRYMTTGRIEDPKPRLASYDMVHVSEQDIDEYNNLVQQADESITYFLFELEGTEDTVTGRHALTGLANCDSYETADAMADDAASFDEVCWDIVLSRSDALVLFQKPHDSFVPILGISSRFH